mmetsp:Transcript_17317/g.50344  ORF Transcript_17317/g.50344 Transcript_17317/m.50344 type:complete len:306 (+) Transcript_17317:139-1056(+)
MRIVLSTVETLFPFTSPNFWRHLSLKFNALGGSIRVTNPPIQCQTTTDLCYSRRRRPQGSSSSSSAALPRTSRAPIGTVVHVAHVLQQAAHDPILHLIVVLAIRHDPRYVFVRRTESSRLPRHFVLQRIPLGTLVAPQNAVRDVGLHPRQGGARRQYGVVILFRRAILVVIFDAIDESKLLMRAFDLGQGARFHDVVDAFARSVLTYESMRSILRFRLLGLPGIPERYECHHGHLEKVRGGVRLLERTGDGIATSGTLRFVVQIDLDPLIVVVVVVGRRRRRRRRRLFWTVRSGGCCRCRCRCRG